MAELAHDNNIVPFPAPDVPQYQNPEEGIEPEAHDEHPIVMLPYQDPLQRALGTLGKQAVIGFTTAVLLGCIDIATKAATGEFLNDRAMLLALLVIVLHAANTAVQKYGTASADDKAGA